MYLFNKHQLIDHFGLDETKLIRYLVSIENGYVNTNPYHNSIHAADVMLTSNFLMRRLSQFAQPLDQLALLFAACAHDFKHPGLSNPYQIHMGSEFALTWNDTGVL